MAKKLVFAFLAGSTLLTACAEPEVILPGKRIAVQTVLDDTVTDAAVATNKTAPFAAPKSVTNTIWAQGHGTPSARTDNPALGANPTLAWVADIGAGDSSRARISADPIVVDGRVFTLDAEMVVVATSTNGETLWRHNLTPTGENVGDATGGGFAYGDGRVYVTTGYGVLYALDPKSGEILWSQTLSGTGNTRPVYHDGLVYLVSNDTTAWAIEASDGRIRWQSETQSDSNNLTGSMGPSVSDKFVVFGYGSGDLQAIFRKGGLGYWTSSLAGGRAGRAIGLIEDIATMPVIVGNRVYAANGSGHIVALSLEDGERLWTTPQGVRGDIWAAGNSVFFVNDLGHLVRLAADTGEQIWQVQLPGYVKFTQKKATAVYTHQGPILAGGQLVVASNDGLIRLFDPVSGALRGSVAIPAGATTNPVVAGATLYLVSTDGKLYAFR